MLREIQRDHDLIPAISASYAVMFVLILTRLPSDPCPTYPCPGFRLCVAGAVSVPARLELEFQYYHLTCKQRKPFESRLRWKLNCSFVDCISVCLFSHGLTLDYPSYFSCSPKSAFLGLPVSFRCISEQVCFFTLGCWSVTRLPYPRGSFWFPVVSCEHGDLALNNFTSQGIILLFS